MDYVVEYKDGEVISSAEKSWSQLPKDRDIKSIGIHDNKDVYHELKGYDIYFHSDCATSYFSTMVGSKNKYTWEYRLIGAFHRNGKGKIIKTYITKETEIFDAHITEYSKTFSKDSFIFNRGLIND